MVRNESLNGTRPTKMDMRHPSTAERRPDRARHQTSAGYVTPDPIATPGTATDTHWTSHMAWKSGITAQLHSLKHMSPQQPRKARSVLARRSVTHKPIHMALANPIE